jgi:hypothetical protein
MLNAVHWLIDVLDLVDRLESILPGALMLGISE